MMRGLVFSELVSERVFLACKGSMPLGGARRQILRRLCWLHYQQLGFKSLIPEWSFGWRIITTGMDTEFEKGELESKDDFFSIANSRI